MIYLNFTDLSEEAQERLIANSKEDVKKKYGKDLMDYATKHHTNLDQMLDEEALRNLYSYTYVFNIWLIILKNCTSEFSGVFSFLVHS